MSAGEVCARLAARIQPHAGVSLDVPRSSPPVRTELRVALHLRLSALLLRADADPLQLAIWGAIRADLARDMAACLA